MERIDAIADNIKLLDEGIWVAGDTRGVSYPEGQHDRCFVIEEESFWFRHRNNCIIEAMRRFPPAGTVFDVGGGNGYVAWGLTRSGFDTVLVEPNMAGARNAKARGLKTIVCATLEDTGFRKNTLPAIGLFDVLEHIDDDIGYLRNTAGLLTRNGRIYLTAPAFNLLWSAEDDAAMHFRRYSLSEISGKLRLAGYHVDYATYFFSLFPLPILLFRTIPSAMGLRRERTFARNRKEHDPGRGVLGRLLDSYLQRELSALRTSRMSFGSSCLVIARARA